MKPREIVLAILLILVGIGIYAAREGKLHFDGSDGNFFFNFTEEFAFEETKDLEPPYPAGLNIVNSHGDVEIQGTDEEKITVTFQKRIRRRRKEDAVKVSDELKMIVGRDGERISISTNRNEFKKTNFETHFKVRIPRRLAVGVTDSHGDVRIFNAAEASVENSHGLVAAGDIAGRLTIDDSHGDVEAEAVGSGAKIATTHGRVNAARIKGETTLGTSHGDIRAEDIQGALIVTAYNSSVEGIKISGSVRIKNSYDKVVLNGTGAVEVSGHHSDISIDDAKGDVKIDDSYGDVFLAAIRGNLKIDGKSLAVSGKGVKGDVLDIRTSNENIELSDFSGKTFIVFSHGEAMLSPADLEQALEVNATYSDITLHWPRGSVNPLEARTRYGDIAWELGTKPDFEQKNGSTVMKGFSKEALRPQVKLSTTHANIRLLENNGR